MPGTSATAAHITAWWWVSISRRLRCSARGRPEPRQRQLGTERRRLRRRVPVRDHRQRVRLVDRLGRQRSSDPPASRRSGTRPRPPTTSRPRIGTPSTKRTSISVGLRQFQSTSRAPGRPARARIGQGWQGLPARSRESRRDRRRKSRSTQVSTNEIITAMATYPGTTAARVAFQGRARPARAASRAISSC